MFVFVGLKIFYETIKVFTKVEGQYYKNKQGKNMWLYDIANQKDIKIFLDWIYQDSIIRLIRKYDDYIKFINTRDFSKETWFDVNNRIHNQADEIRKRYEIDKISILQLSKEYQCSPPTINRLLKELGVTIRNTHNQ